MARSADEIKLQPRPVNFRALEQHLHQQKADIIFVCFGLNEAFKGPDNLESFKQQSDIFLLHLQHQKFNGHSAPQIVLIRIWGTIATKDILKVGLIENTSIFRA